MKYFIVTVDIRDGEHVYTDKFVFCGDIGESRMADEAEQIMNYAYPFETTDYREYVMYQVEEITKGDFKVLDRHITTFSPLGTEKE